MRSFHLFSAVVLLLCLPLCIGCSSDRQREAAESEPPAATPVPDEAVSEDEFEAGVAEINAFAREHDLDVITPEQVEAMRKMQAPVRHLLDVGSMDLTPPALSVGQTWSRKVRLLSQMLLPMGSNFFDTESNMVLDYEVVAADGDGFTIEITIAAVRATAKLMYRHYSFDNTSDPAVAVKDTAELSQQQIYKNAFAGLAGLKYKARLDRIGNLVKLMDVDPALRTVADGEVKYNQGSEQTTMLLSRGALGDYASMAMFASGLGTALVRGKAWETPGAAKAPSTAEVDTTRIHRINTFEEVDGIKIANITYDTSYGPEVEAQTPPVKRRASGALAVVDVRGIGEITYSLDRSAIINYVEKTRIEIKSSQPNTPVGQARTERKNKIFYLINRFVEMSEEDQPIGL